MPTQDELKDRIVEAGHDTAEYIRKKKLIRRGIILGSIILLALILMLLYSFQVRFLIYDEIRINLDPMDLSIHTTKDSENISFSLDVENFMLCDSVCSYRFRDISKNKTIDEGAAKEEISKTYTIRSDIEGQRIYSFEASCRNTRTAMCRTQEEERFRSSIVTANFELSEIEQDAKTRQGSYLKEYAVANTQSLLTLEKASLTLDRFPEAKEVKALKSAHSGLQEDLSEKLIRMNKNLDRWDSREYLEMDLTEKEVDDARALTNRSRELLQGVSELVKTHNRAVNITRYLAFRQEKVTGLLNYFLKTQSTTLEKETRDLASALEKLSGSLSSGTLMSYSSLMTSLSDSLSTYQELSRKKTSDVISRSTQASRDLAKHQMLYNSLSHKRGISAILNVTTTEQGDMDELIDDCEAYYRTVDLIEGLNEISQPVELSEALENYTAYLNIETENKLTNSSKPLPYLVRNVTVANTTYQNLWNITTINISGSSVCDNLSRYAAADIDLEMDISAETIPLPDLKGTANFSIQDNPPMCCSFGSCTPCCDEGCEKPVPVVFVHGHLFNEQNSPATSMASFAKIQRRLEKEGYINAGELDMIGPNREILEGEWQRSGQPVSVRVSYYYIVYYDLGAYSVTAKKSEGLENYAIRLKEALDLVRFRTGSDKVDIVAHSMGGLVAREYLALFGDDHVRNLLLIATPNQGIRGDVNRLCSVLGASKECTDMQKGSIFLKRLNARASEVDTYTITATGCDMDGEKGDGIVTEKSATLDYAENYVIEGECTDLFGTDLHSKVLDPAIYPKTYELILSVLG